MKSLLVGAVSVGVLVATAGYASAQEPPPPMKVQTGPDAEVTADGLYRVDNSLMALAYVKPDMNLQGYTKFMLDPVSVAYQKDPHGRRRSMGGGQENFALSPSQMNNLKTWFQEEVVEALTEDGGYELVDAPAPDVLRIATALLDLVVKVPTQQTAAPTRAVTRSTAEVTLMVELRDSESGEILARVADRRDPTGSSMNENFSYVSPSYVQADMRELFKFWAGIMRARLDEVTTMGSP